MDVAFVALVGVIIGAVLKWILDRHAKRMEEEKQVQRHILELRRAAYVAFLRTASELLALPRNGGEEHREPRGRFAGCGAEIELIASPEVQKRALAFAVIVENDLFGPKPTVPKTGGSGWFQARSEFVEAVRRELGLPA
jgi:hypothetical protein